MGVDCSYVTAAHSSPQPDHNSFYDNHAWFHVRVPNAVFKPTSQTNSSKWLVVVNKQRLARRRQSGCASWSAEACLVSTRRSREPSPGESPRAKRSTTPHGVATPRTDMENHQSKHRANQLHQCNHCKKIFMRKWNLDEHLRIHTNERPYRCDICGSRFKQAGQLSEHRRIHTGERPFRCEHCGNRFKLNHHLVKHVRTHTGERPYQCQLCRMTFTQNEHLKRHVRSHKGEKPFQCRFCANAFAVKRNLKRHEERAHSSITGVP